MKVVLFLLLAVVGLGLLIYVALRPSVENLEPRLRQQLQWLQAYDAGRGRGVTFEARKDFEQSLGETIWNISRVIEAAPSPDWAHPSAQRRQVIARIQRIIAPYNTELLSLGFRQDPESSSLATQSLTLLNYTQPDDAFASALRDRLTQPLRESGTAADLLFEHRLLNEQDKQTILEQFANEKNWDAKVGRALGLSSMGMPEAVPVLAALLSVPFTLEGTGSNTGVGMTENDALIGYGIAADAIQYLGTSAKSLVPLLEQRMQEIRALLPPSKQQLYLGILLSAVECANGRRSKGVPDALNASGFLLPTTPPHSDPDSAVPQNP